MIQGPYAEGAAMRSVQWVIRWLATIILLTACSAPEQANIEEFLLNGEKLAISYAQEKSLILLRTHRPEVHIVSEPVLYREYAERHFIQEEDVPYGLRGFQDEDGLWLLLWRDTDTKWHELGHWYFGPSEEEANAFMYYAASHYYKG